MWSVSSAMQFRSPPKFLNAEVSFGGEMTAPVTCMTCSDEPLGFLRLLPMGRQPAHQMIQGCYIICRRFCAPSGSKRHFPGAEKTDAILRGKCSFKLCAIVRGHQAIVTPSRPQSGPYTIAG